MVCGGTENEMAGCGNWQGARLRVQKGWKFWSLAFDLWFFYNVIKFKIMKKKSWWATHQTCGPRGWFDPKQACSFPSVGGLGWPESLTQLYGSSLDAFRLFSFILYLFICICMILNWTFILVWTIFSSGMSLILDRCESQYKEAGYIWTENVDASRSLSFSISRFWFVSLFRFHFLFLPTSLFVAASTHFASTILYFWQIMLAEIVFVFISVSRSCGIL